jgi:phosphoserine phosphatase RsbU/P
MNYNIDHAPCIYFSSDDDRTLMEVNERLCNKLGYRKDELCGKKSDILFTIATNIFFQTHFFPLVKLNGHAEEIFITLKSKNGGELPVLFNAERKLVGGIYVTRYVGIIVYNREKFEKELIAARNTAEKALEENTLIKAAKQQLEIHTSELDKHLGKIRRHNEELKQVNHIVTHDMQEPLRKLSVFSNMLIEEIEQAQKRNLAEKIKKVTQEMQHVISGLQQYVWLNDSELHMAEIDLGNVLHGIKQQLEKEHNVTIELESDQLVNIIADQEQMQLLFLELFSNAVRFRKEADRVYINVSATILQLNRFRHVEGRYEYIDFVRIEVKDKGKGFDNTFSKQAFELFRRLHAESGSGVGLALCRKIIDNHNGEISIQSKPGEETIVSFQIPLAGIFIDTQDRISLKTDKKPDENEFKSENPIR